MFYMTQIPNKIAIKVATCFFTQGNVELTIYNESNV